MKRCSKCGEEKEFSAFSPDRRHRDGLQSQCRACCAERHRKGRRDRPAIYKAWQANAQARQRIDPRKQALARERRKRWRESNPDKVKSAREKYQNTNRELIAERAAKRSRDKYRANPIWAAKERALCILRQSLGVSSGSIPRDLIEAKAAQLLVRRFIRKGK